MVTRFPFAFSFCTDDLFAILKVRVSEVSFDMTCSPIAIARISRIRKESILSMVCHLDGVKVPGKSAEETGDITGAVLVLGGISPVRLPTKDALTIIAARRRLFTCTGSVSGRKQCGFIMKCCNIYISYPQRMTESY